MEKPPAFRYHLLDALAQFLFLVLFFGPFFADRAPQRNNHPQDHQRERQYEDEGCHLYRHDPAGQQYQHSQR